MGRCGWTEHISHYLAPRGGRGTGASLYTVFLLVQSGAHRPRQGPPSTLQQSDVHLKLSLIPNCVLPVVIVQVVQVVHFYFGVFH